MKLRRAVKLHEVLVKGNYRVNVLEGKVYSEKSGKALSPFLNGRGYKTVFLFMDGKRYRYRVREIIAYVGGLDIVGYRRVTNHINGVKTDNRLSNLEACTVAENNAHARETGLWTAPYSSKAKGGELNIG